MRSKAKAPSAGSSRGNNRPARPAGVLAAMLACLAVLLGISAPPALAAPSAGPGWVPKATFEAPFSPEPPESRNAIAVDSHGNVFLANVNNPYVIIYAPDPSAGDAPLAEISVPEAATGACCAVRTLTVDPGDDSVYVDQPATFGGTSIDRFVSDGKPTPTYTLDPGFKVPMAEGFAVDPITHDLLVADPAVGGVHRYDTSGTLVGTITTPVAPTYIAAATDGSFYVASASGPDVVHMGGDGTVLGTIAGVGALRGITWDSTHGKIVTLVGDNSIGNRLKAYSPAGQLVSASPAESEGLGIVFDAGSGLLYQISPANTAAYSYETATYPGAEAPAVTGISPHGAHLSAEVDPGESGPGETPAGSKAHFEYSADGGKTWKSTPDKKLPTPGPQTVEADLTGLLPNFGYQVRFIASNSRLKNTTSVVSFSTPEIAPEAVTGSATDLSETSAVLNGAINPGGFQTTYHFEYGLTAAYGARVPAGIEATAGNGRESRLFARTLSGLQPGTTYHFRIVAENKLGLTEGLDRTFTTVSPGAFPARHYEQVTPADKGGVPVDGEFGIYADGNSSAVAYMTKGTTHGAALHSRAFSIRGADDWSSVGLDPPLNPVNIPGLDTIYNVSKAISDDLTRSFVISNRALSPGANENGVNLYRVDIASNHYTLVGTTPQPLIKQFSFLGGGGFFQAAAPDMSWIVFTSGVPLLPAAEGLFGDALYRWSEDDGLELVSVLPNGTSANTGAYSDSAVPLNTASADGSRVYFDSPFPEPGFYLREGGQTKAISVSRVPGEPTTPQPAVFMAASENGRYAFFATSLSGTKLTPDAPGSRGDLFRYDASDESLEYLGAGFGEVGVAHGNALGVSRDGQTFYFSSDEGLRVWRDGAVTTVSPGSIGEDIRSANSAFVSPNGRYIVFEGIRAGKLTGPVERYDAETDELTCISCLPDGSPSNDEFETNEYYGPLPGSGEERTFSNRYERVVTDNGTVFFNSGARLVAADVNGKLDVYEYRSGQNHLISPGNGPYSAYMGDFSEDARDVYFATTQKLVGRDNDGQMDIYDARIGGELPVQNPPLPQECLRDDCKATPNSGPEVPFGGSEALSGPGNVQGGNARKRCAKGTKARKVKGKTRCIKQSKAKKKSAKRAGANRRQGR